MAPTTSAPPVIPAGLSYPEFLEWLDEDVHAEWVGGEIIVMSPASRLHQRLAGFVTAVLKLYVEPRGLGEVLPAPFQMRPRVDLPGREPDVLFVAQERLEIVQDTFVDGAADLVVEIISRESRTRDTTDKFAEYEEGGVKEYWLLDPEEQKASFHALGSKGFVPIEVSSDVFRSKVLDGFWLDLNWLWAIPTPTIPEVQQAWKSCE